MRTISRKDFTIYGCPYCGRRHGRYRASGDEKGIWLCLDCSASCVVMFRNEGEVDPHPLTPTTSDRIRDAATDLADARALFDIIHGHLDRIEDIVKSAAGVLADIDLEES